MRATVCWPARRIMSAAPILPNHSELKRTSHILAAERLAGQALARRVADHPGEVADQEDDLVAEVLQLAHLVQHHGVAQMDIRRGGIQPQLDAQGHAGGAALGQLAGEFGLDQQLVAAALGYTQIGFDFGSDRGF
ncbi:hypothetical protein G6F50_016662 [Rhizopus delemar]|uniref:Uncharacterized protein n=1 Tax=Rhizopus delemar TaxID=936053 RepID=A0A9P6XSV4_9FUNG|nr:hypothetical protein G6F50_016662 [Rhizopus delemar]